ncbi:Uncharacterised protein [Mycobacteroides abscessus subsp. abscessus]|nr:Uncharacterised protein [Mycobacteroides abscessus subsp. abscessus]
MRHRQRLLRARRPPCHRHNPWNPRRLPSRPNSTARRPTTCRHPRHPHPERRQSRHPQSPPPSRRPPSEKHPRHVPQRRSPPPPPEKPPLARHPRGKHRVTARPRRHPARGAATVVVAAAAGATSEGSPSRQVRVALVHAYDMDGHRGTAGAPGRRLSVPPPGGPRARQPHSPEVCEPRRSGRAVGAARRRTRVGDRPGPWNLQRAHRVTTPFRSTRAVRRAARNA